MKAQVKKTKSLPTFFQPTKDSINQVVVVEVNIEKDDDGIADCIKGCFSCCIGIGKAAAKGA